MKFFKRNKSEMSKKEIKSAVETISDFNTMLSDEIGKSDLKLLEIRSLKNGIELSKQTIESLKNDFKRNIFYIFIGGFIGFISSYTLTTFQSKSEERIIELSKLLNGRNEQQSDFQKHLNDMNKEIFSLRKELDSLKNK
jgi:peptidoglycan hydrolase CwlO-like protein